MRHESCTVVALVTAAMPGASGPGEASPGTGRYGTIPAGTGVAAWHGRHFELPDYYLVLAAAAGNTEGSADPDFYLGPLRAVRPHRVVVVAASDGPEQAAGVRDALRSLRHGPWWPPLDELLDTARRFFAGGLAEAGTSLATGPR